MEGYSKRKGFNGKRRKSLLKGSFSEDNERLEFTFLTKSEPIYFLLNYKFLSNFDFLLSGTILSGPQKTSRTIILPRPKLQLQHTHLIL